MTAETIGERGSQTRVVSRLGELSFPYWFPTFQWSARRVPPTWLARLSEATVERAMWSRESVRDAVLGNFAHVLGLPTWTREVQETSRAMLSQHSRLWIDLLKHAGSSRDPRALVSKTLGTEHLLHARAGGKGALLLTAHVGNFELGGLFLRQLGIDLAAVYAPDPSPVVESHRERARTCMGVRGIPVTSSPLSFLAVLKALEGGTFVAIQGDRDYAGTGRIMRFFGRDVSFPIGPFKLAAASGAPLLPVFVIREPDGRYRTVVEEPIRLGLAGSRIARADVLEAGLAVFVALLERTIRAFPSQWYRFTPFWQTG